MRYPFRHARLKHTVAATARTSSGSAFRCNLDSDGWDATEILRIVNAN